MPHHLRVLVRDDLEIGGVHKCIPGMADSLNHAPPGPPGHPPHKCGGQGRVPCPNAHHKTIPSGAQRQSDYTPRPSRLVRPPCGLEFFYLHTTDRYRAGQGKSDCRPSPSRLIRRHCRPGRSGRRAWSERSGGRSGYAAPPAWLPARHFSDRC